MFSEYASRFLAQSQSRLNFTSAPDQQPNHERGRRQNPSAWRSTTTSRINQPRGGNPYQPSSSQTSNFPFLSRQNPQPAPLFFSAADEFREENDAEEHEREIAEYYALQKSRRHLGGSVLQESSEEGEESTTSLDDSGRFPYQQDGGFGRGGGIRSSWRGGVTGGRGRGQTMDHVDESPELSPINTKSSAGHHDRGNMTNVRLEDTIRSETDDEPPDDLIEDPPSIQRFHSSSYQPDDQDELLREFPVSEPEQESVPEFVPQSSIERPRHDAFWGHVYLLAFTGMFTSWFVVFLHTDVPKNHGKQLGDTIYTTLHGSFYLLAISTLISIFVSLFWLAALRAYVRNLVYGMVISVPVVLYSFSLYQFISSLGGRWKGSSTQDSLMRWSSLIPFILGSLWLLTVYRGRLAMQKAITILEFATKILGTNPALLVVGFSVLGTIVTFTWIWLSMFTRVFLGGHLSNRSGVTQFFIDASTWWLGVYFVIVYLWTIGIIFALQRTITSATVSQWYFHRLAVPAPSSQTIVKAAVTHSATTLFGTVALATALGLMVRLPLLLLPRRVTMLIGIAMFSLIPTPIGSLINPLSLTYAAIHSQPLAVSARGLMQLRFLAPNDATTSLHPDTFNRNKGDGWSRDASPLLPYRLAKLLLHSTRIIMSLALCFGAWVSTARSLKVAGTEGFRGSLYAYIVGLIAGAIGWGILGAMEGVLACIVDAVVVCWASEVGSSGRGEVRYCREAAYLFSDDEVGRVSLA